MRVYLVFAAATLALAGCGQDEQAQDTQNLDGSLTAESIVANDITAIDAVTADAANMAADVDINFTNDQVLYNGGAASASAATSPADPPSRRTGSRPAPRSAADRSESPVTNQD
jgi:hypothetical protein